MSGTILVISFDPQKREREIYVPYLETRKWKLNELEETYSKPSFPNTTHFPKENNYIPK